MAIGEKSKKIDMLSVLGLLATGVAFLIGFWHAGMGLSYFKVLNLEYGGFIAAFGILAILIIAYSKAITGSYIALILYIIFATVTFICNLNSFYPTYRGDGLVREELANHERMFVNLKEGLADDLKDPELDAFKKDIEADRNAVVIQAENYGIGPLTRELVHKIEGKLKVPEGTITIINSGRTPSQWKEAAQKLSMQIDEQLQNYVGKNLGHEKVKLVNDVNEYHKIYSQKIKDAVNSKEEFRAPPLFVAELLKSQKEVCEAAKKFTPKNWSSYCVENYESPNADLGKFSHTIRSSIATLSNDGTKVIIGFCFFLDFLFPLAIFLLVRRSDSPFKKWRVGNEFKPEVIR